jgi:hypothetical protein
VFVILDAARDQRIFGAVDGTYLEKACLYGGELPWQLQMVAPYLVQLKQDDRFTRYVLDHGWGNSWGVFLRSESSLQAVRKHLKGFLRVRGPKGQRLLFRYYDPRVLRVYLPTCTIEELQTVYGPVSHYLVESEEGEAVLEFGFDRRQLKEVRVPLAAAVGA